MGNKVALGTSSCFGKAVITKPNTIEEKLDVLQKRMDALDEMYNNTLEEQLKSKTTPYNNRVPVCINNDNIPIGTHLYGVFNGFVHEVVVEADGYYIGMNKYNSLLSVTTAITNNSTVDFLSYWKLSDGRTIRGVFKNIKDK